MNVFEKLSKIQSEVKAPKDLYNSFGGYNHRSCESILEAVKPILAKYKCLIILRDEVCSRDGRFYIKSEAEFIDCEAEERSISVSAFAREQESKKGADGAQITGATSSYARKYALTGLLLLDDTKDPDATNKHGKDNKDNALPFLEAQTNNSATACLEKLNAVLSTLRGHSSQMYNNMLSQIEQKYGTKDLSALNKTQCYEVINFVNKQLEKSTKQ